MSFLTLFCILLFTVGFTKSDAIDREKAKKEDPAGYEAITQLHKSMDDDSSGSIDPLESKDFLQNDMDMKNNKRQDLTVRQDFFHRNDDAITVEDMWNKWVSSQERNWTLNEIVEWLTDSVELPQYAELFATKSVTGISLPRMAIQNSSFLQTILGVTNPVHRRKLQLKSMDVVLFGYRSVRKSYLKDALLVTLLILALAAYWFAIYQRKASLKQTQALTEQLGKLKDMEQEFTDLQNKLEEERSRLESGKDSLEDEEIENREELHSLKWQLQEAERRNPMLQALLRKTYELEISRINQQKLESLKEMNEARELVEKLKKKQSSLLNQIRSVHGSDTEEIDGRILNLRHKMEHISHAIDECEHRWSEIEYLSGFKITSSVGSVVHPRVAALTKGSGYARPHFYAASSFEMDHDSNGLPLPDVTGAPFGDPSYRGSYNVHHRQAGNNNFAATRVTKTQPSLLLHGGTNSELCRSNPTLDESGIPRSASVSDLVNGNGSIVQIASNTPSPMSDTMNCDANTNSINYYAKPTMGSEISNAKSRITPGLGNVGKQNSQISTASSGSNQIVVKPKKKFLNFFSGNREKKD